MCARREVYPINSAIRQIVFHIWNDLPEDVVLADSLNQYNLKNKLEYFWKQSIQILNDL